MRNYLEKTLKFLEMKDNNDWGGCAGLGVTSFLKTAEFFIVLCVKNYISTRSLRREGVGFLVFVFVPGVFT